MSKNLRACVESVNFVVDMYCFSRIYAFATACVLLAACGSGGSDGSVGERCCYPDASLAEILSPSADNPYDVHIDEAPDSGCERLKLRPIGHLRPLFNDSNYLHLAAAQALGIRPIAGFADAWNTTRPLMPVRSCADFYVDDLRHSYPYLVPEAAALLHDIGAAFNDSLEARGGGSYRMKVTSLLRTPSTVRSLRRVNRNAVGESTHFYGTTFDISYSRFICDSITVGRTFEDLKNLLGEVLLDFKKQGRCYVKMERRQACFHITARPPTK